MRKSKSSLINKKAVKDYILEVAKELRPGWSCSRVSAESLLQIDLKVRMMLRNAVRAHRSSCKTFSDII